MRWFKHITRARGDQKLLRLIDEFGLEGYGFYWVVLETIAENMDETGKTEVTLSEDTWRNICHISKKKIKKMADFCQILEIFSIKFEKNTITINCPKLLKYKDEYTRKKDKNSGQTPDKLRNTEAKNNTSNNNIYNINNITSIKNKGVKLGENYTLTQLVEYHIARLGYTPSVSERKEMNLWTKKYSAENIEYAYVEAMNNDKRSWKYIAAILDRLNSQKSAVEEVVLGTFRKMIENNPGCKLGDLYKSFAGEQKKVLKDRLLIAGINGEHLNTRIEDLPLDKIFGV